MYYKLPVVTYDVGGISEIVSPETGFLVEKNDEDQFAKEVCGVLSSWDHNRIQNAYSLVNRKYKNDRIARKFALSYEKLISSK